MDFDDIVERSVEEAREICATPFEADETDIVPKKTDLDDEDNFGLLIETAILYCDMRASSEVVEDHRRGTAARIYRSFLNMVVDVAVHFGGKIRAFDGDRAMVLFDADDEPLRSAIQTGLGIQIGLEDELNRIFLRHFKREVHCGVGIDSGRMLAVRVGGRGRSISDLIWVGEPANNAAKLSDEADSGEIVIANVVYEEMPEDYRSPGILRRDTLWTPSPFVFNGHPDSYRCSWKSLLDHLPNEDE